MNRHQMLTLLRLAHPSKDGPPFAQVIPCPFCGVTEDRGHDVAKHVNPALGVPA